MDNKKKTLTLFSIVMINIIAVDSIRSLPLSAQYGFSLIFYYLIGGLCFLIPSALVSAELGTAWPETGGLYVWVKAAFGKSVGSVIIWLNWIFNLAWYPTVMGVTAGVSAYLIDPALAENKFYIISVILSLFWIATILNCYGMKISAWVSIVGATLGTLLPMFFIIVLSIFFYLNGNPLAIEMSWSAILPTDCCFDKLGYFSSILFGLLGLEMVATHAGEMVDVKRDYPRALFISVIIILSSTVLASLAIAVVVPNNELNLVVGVLQAFQIYFDYFNIPYFIYIVSGAIVIGALSGVSAWIIGPTKGIMVASKDGTLPKYLTMQNSHGVPVHALLTQGVIVTILSLFYLYMPSVNSTFIFLSIITSQFAMIVYITLFAASIVLHYKKKDVKRTFKIPGGNIGIWTTACLGITISSLAFIVGFIPPKEVLITNIFFYEFMLIGVMILLSILPLLFVKFSSKDL